MSLKEEFTPSTYNNPELTKRLVGVWKKRLGPDNVETTHPTMGGEDFSEYSLPDHSIPAFDFHVGAVDPAKIAASQKRGESRCRACTRANLLPCPNRLFELALSP